MALWKWFQKAYDQIDAWDFDEETKAKLQKLADMMPAKVAKQVTSKVQWLCTTAMKTFGKKWVEQIFQQIMDFLKASLEGLQKKDK